MVRVAAAGLLLASTQNAQDLSTSAAQLNQFSRAVQTLAERVSPSVVRITATKFTAERNSGRTDVVSGREQSIGSGVVVDPDGYILTNAHVVDGAQHIKVDLVSSGEQSVADVLARTHQLPVDAGIVGIFKEGDLALIKVAKTGLPALKFADYDKLHQGQVVFAFGSPEGLQNSVSMGVVSSIARQPNIDSPFLNLQTDTPINPGNSGGPLVNGEGEVVGLNTFILSQSGGNEGVGFAIPSPLLRWVYTSMRKYGHVHRSSVGISLQTITPVLAQALDLKRDTGVLVSDILPGGPAETAGMKLNDIVLSIGGKPIDSLPAMLGFFFQHGGGEHVRFEVLRASERVTLDVVTLEQTDQVDRLADLADPVKNVVPQLGLMGVTVDQRVLGILGTLRLPTGVAVVARIESSGMSWGLEVGDVIHSFNTKFVYNLDDLKSALTGMGEGSPVAMLVERHGQLEYMSFEF
jgi:serine protease Do